MRLELKHDPPPPVHRPPPPPRQSDCRQKLIHSLRALLISRLIVRFDRSQSEKGDPGVLDYRDNAKYRRGVYIFSRLPKKRLVSFESLSFLSSSFSLSSIGPFSSNGANVGSGRRVFI